jgi:hypothetical protein
MRGIGVLGVDYEISNTDLGVMIAVTSNISVNVVQDMFKYKARQHLHSIVINVALCTLRGHIVSFNPVHFDGCSIVPVPDDIRATLPDAMHMHVINKKA